MKYQIEEEAWPAIDRFFQEMPEVFKKLPIFQEVLQQQALQNQRQDKQQTLIHLLRCKFPDVSNDIVQHIEAIFDIEQLNNSLEQILFANDLVDMDFKVPKTQE